MAARYNRARGAETDACSGDVADVLPANIRERRSKTHYNSVYYVGLTRNQSYLEDLIRKSPVEELGLFNKECSAVPTVAVGHQILITAYYLLRRQEDYTEVAPATLDERRRAQARLGPWPDCVNSASMSPSRPRRLWPRRGFST